MRPEGLPYVGHQLRCSSIEIIRDFRLARPLDGRARIFWWSSVFPSLSIIGVFAPLVRWCAWSTLGDYQYFRGQSRPTIPKRASIISRARARSGSVSAISTVSSSSQSICDHRAIAYIRANSGCFSSHWNTVLRPGIVLSEQICLSVSPSTRRSKITSAISTL